jgi:hypothetical protein
VRPNNVRQSAALKMDTGKHFLGPPTRLKISRKMVSART